jgi:ankyrin repeat protein
MRNLALTGPEKARQYRAYIAARAAAIEALVPFYRDQFGRTQAEAQRFAALYLDRKISDGLELDPDDDTAAALFAADYAVKHTAQWSALAGDTAALRQALGPEPRAIAKGVTGDLDEPLVSDALEHPETLRAVLELGLEPNEVGASGRTPLMVAARLDLVEAAGILLAHGATVDTPAKDAVAQTDSTGDPLCMTADKAAGDTPGRTALSYAAELGSPDMVRLLLDHNADPASPDSAGRRPADYVKNRTGDSAQSAKIAKMLK